MKTKTKPKPRTKTAPKPPARSAEARFDAAKARAHADQVWAKEIVPALTEYIRIPNKSPHFDPKWRENGHMMRAVELIANWCKKRAVPGLSQEVVQLPGRTPVILMEVPSRGGVDDTVLLYGHLDKQPEMVGWRAGLGPWEPVLQGDRLYGRGGADDGYAAFASLTALEILAKQETPHARAIVLIEACEESGSPDLPAYVDHLSTRLGKPSLVVCLDSGCGDYERLWNTTSLRGLLGGSLVVEILREGVHSGDASGIVPDSFRILRTVLSRLEDETSGKVRCEAVHVPIPEQRAAQAKKTAKILAKTVHSKFPFVAGAKPMEKDIAQLILNRTWRPVLTITGQEGMPDLVNAGNVLRPKTAVKVSLRLPPRCVGERALKAVKTLLEKDPPYGAKVRFESADATEGWDAPPIAPWLEESVARASEAHFGNPSASMGEGGTIPFMGMLGKKFPAAQFLITGVLGPESNAHGPNEFLHVPTGRRLTACVAQVLADHAVRTS
jgi:acetylornithine deacetylase/succinyl-diaminopimelate desuccinylase-like protein